MRLVMVDPGKFKSDKIKPHTFHHFKNNEISVSTDKGDDEMASSNKDDPEKLNKEIIDHVLDDVDAKIMPAEDETSCKTKQVNSGHLKKDKIQKGSLDNNKRRNRFIKSSVDISESNLKTKYIFEDETSALFDEDTGISTWIRHSKKENNELVIRMDPKYKSSKTFSHYENPRELEQSTVSKKDSATTTPANYQSIGHKTKKITFVKTIPVSNGNINVSLGNNGINSGRTVFLNSKFVKQSSKYSLENDKNIMDCSLDKSESENTDVEYRNYGLRSNDDILDGIIFSTPTVKSETENNIGINKFQMYQMDNNRNKTHNDSNLGQTVKSNMESKVKQNKTQVNPPVLDGYSTYTFKVNLKEK